MEVVLCKDPRGKQVTRDVDSNLIDFDIFRIENGDSYTNLQVPISIPEVTQIATIVEGVPLVPIGLVNVVIVGTNQDSHDNDPQIAMNLMGKTVWTMMVNLTSIYYNGFCFKLR